MKTASTRIPRLFIDEALANDSVQLSGDRARYLARALRLTRGDPVVLFNGRGQECRAIVRRLMREGGELQITDMIDPVPESPLELRLVHAIAKSDAMDLVVQKATELGVREIVPVFTQFSVVKLSEERATQRLQHWRRVASSACEQCGRHFLPQIRPPGGLPEYLRTIEDRHLKLVMNPDCSAHIDTVQSHPEAVSILIGPEGGFSGKELDHARAAGFQEISLGPRTLRTETAALVGCALIQARWGDL